MTDKLGQMSTVLEDDEAIIMDGGAHFLSGYTYIIIMQSLYGKFMMRTTSSKDLIL